MGVGTTNSRAKESTRRPRHNATTEDMHVQVRNRLIGIGATIDDATISTFRDILVGGDARRSAGNLTEESGVRVGCVREPSHVLTRNDQHVDGRLRIRVPEGDDIRILVHDVDRKLAQRDFAKNAFGH